MRSSHGEQLHELSLKEARPPRNKHEILRSSGDSHNARMEEAVYKLRGESCWLLRGSEMSDWDFENSQG